MNMTPMRAIRAKCLDCCGGIRDEVKRCTAIKCPLHAFRSGKNPNRQLRAVTDEQRQQMRERALNMRRAKNDNENTVEK